MTKKRLFYIQATPNTIFNCPLCRGPNAEFESVADIVPYLQGWCPACTNMRITPSALDIVQQRSKAHLLSAFLRDMSELDFQLIDDTNVERFADSVSEIPLVERFDRLLFVLCERTRCFGDSAAFSHETDWPLIRARNSNEVLAMLRELRKEGYLDGDGRVGLSIQTPTRSAFERYSELRNAGPMSQQAFVAMAFAPEYDTAWQDIIKPGIIAAGYRPFRVDQKEHADKVDDLIMAEIQRSKFLVADFSGQRGGVYFEAGFALGLGRPVIWMCHDAEKDKLHFDTRQYNHILYIDPADAQKKLQNRITAMLGEGTYKNE